MQRLADYWFALSLAFVSLAAQAEIDEQAMQMLERMGSASKNLNYDGVFTYQTGHKVQSIRIIHSATEHGEVERLLSLEGAAREMIRTNDSVTCIFPEGKQINVDRRPLGRGFPSDLLSRLSSAKPYYDISIGGLGRVADRKARQLKVTPIDQYRYGYDLWVDHETDLLLESNLLTGKGHVLETFAFSSIKLNIDIPESVLKPQISGGQEMTWQRKETVPVTHDEIEQSRYQDLWHIAWLPEGFVLVAEQSRRTSKGSIVEQRVFSDGLSSVSIFIEQKTDSNQHLEGTSQMGAINAFGLVIDDHYITAVGQVPTQTVEKIGRSIEMTD